MNLPNYAYFNGEIVPYAQANVGMLNVSLNYGLAVFGGVRGYWNEEEGQLFVFRPFDHYRRFLQSMSLLRMETTHTPESLTSVTLELLRKENHRQDVYIRPLGYKKDEMVGVRLHGLHDDIAISSLPFGKYVGNDTNAHVTVSSWRRVDDNMIPARGKIAGAYVNTAFAKSDAVLAGFDEAIVLSEDGHVSEGSAENIFIVRNGKVITPSISSNILEGITRRSVMEFVQRELGLEVQERVVDRTELYLCDELFLTGTGAQISAVTQIDHRKVGSGVMGPVATQLRQIFFDAVRGKLPQYREWAVPVYS